MFYIEKTVERDGQSFEIRCMNGRDEMELFNGLTAGESIPVDRLYRLLSKCLTGWKDARSLKGDNLGEFHPDKIEWLSAVDVDWLAAAIMRLSQPSEDEKKTSSDSGLSDPIPKISDVPIASV